ncbi:MAG: transporter substrate-binding domain-containing protein [Fibrobacterota bacterium]
MKMFLLLFVAITSSRAESAFFVRGDNNYPPYEFKDSLGNPTGFNIDLFNAVAEEMELNTTISLGLWDSVRTQLRKDQIDVITGMFYSREREKHFAFSIPFTQISHALFVSDDSSVKSLSDLENKRVLVQQGELMHDFLISSIPAAQPVPVKNPLEALRLLDGKFYDCALLARFQGSYLINQHDLSGIVVREISLPRRDYCFAVRPHNRELLTKINEGLKILRENGTYRQIYLRWFGFDRQNIDLDTWILHGTFSLSVLVMIVAVVIIWNVTLRKTIHQRTRQLQTEFGNRLRAENEAHEKNGHLTLISDNMPVLIAHIDEDERYLYANRAYREFVRKEPEQVIGRKLSDVLTKKTYDKLAPHLKEIRQGNSGQFNLKVYIPHMGQFRYLKITYIPYQGELNEKRSYFVLAQDVTDFAVAEKALRESETNLSITLNSIADGVIATDANQRITRMNPVAQQLTGWNFENAREKALEEVVRMIDPDTRSDIENSAVRVLREGQTAGADNYAILISADGSECRVAYSGAPILDHERRVVGVVLVFHDMTKSYEMEQQLRQAQKMDAIGKLAGGIAHDFNNQLAAMMGYADLMREMAEEGSIYEKYSGKIVQQAQRSADLTNKLLAFARKGKYQIAAVDLHTVISEIASMLAHTIDRRISIRQQLAASPAITRGDSSQLQNALLNIALNARDAMPDGGEILFQTRITTLSKEDYCQSGFNILDGNYVQITIEDTGNGIAPETITHIFEPFFTTKEQGKGTGMGLAAVYGTVKSHNGAVTVDSRYGQGTAFNLFFPLSRESTTLGKTNSPAVIAGAGSILFVDDEKDLCTMAAQMLGKIGYTVITKHDSSQAVDFFRQFHGEIDLVILDLIMPGKSGVDTFMEMRQIDDNIHVLITSGYSIDGEAQKILAHGHSSFIQKPYDKAQLSQAVANMIA